MDPIMKKIEDEELEAIRELEHEDSMPAISRSGSFSGGTGNSSVAKTFEDVRGDFNPINHGLHHEVSIGLHSSRKHYFKCSEETKNDRLSRI
jgi:hypothetical protein